MPWEWRMMDSFKGLSKLSTDNPQHNGILLNENWLLENISYLISRRIIIQSGFGEVYLRHIFPAPNPTFPHLFSRKWIYKKRHKHHFILNWATLVSLVPKLFKKKQRIPFARFILFLTSPTQEIDLGGSTFWTYFQFFISGSYSKASQNYIRERKSNSSDVECTLKRCKEKNTRKTFFAKGRACDIHFTHFRKRKTNAIIIFSNSFFFFKNKIILRMTKKHKIKMPIINS